MEEFINDKMKIMLEISRHLVKIEEIPFCPLNQNEIANLIGCSKVKLNGLLKELIASGYIEMPKKGRYILTTKAEEVIEKYALGEKND